MLIEAEWSKDHVSVIGPYTLLLVEAYIDMVNLRPDEAFTWKMKDRRLGRSGSVK
jgi:hypothetical protein